MLAAGFAIAGGWALVTRRAIPCRCFGATTHHLGWRQVGLLPVWVGLAGAAHLGHSGWNPHIGLVALALILFGSMAWLIRLHLRLFRVVRDDRIAIAPGYAVPAPRETRS